MVKNDLNASFCSVLLPDLSSLVSLQLMSDSRSFCHTIFQPSSRISPPSLSALLWSAAFWRTVFYGIHCSWILPLVLPVSAVLYLLLYFETSRERWRYGTRLYIMAVCQHIVCLGMRVCVCEQEHLHILLDAFLCVKGTVHPKMTI